MVEADSHLKLLSTSILDICKVFEHIDMLCTGIHWQPYTVIPTLLCSDFGYWVTTCGVNMMLLRHGRGWQPPQTAPHINIRGHIKSVWAHWYVVHGNTVAALKSYTHITWPRFWVLSHFWSQKDVIMSWFLRLTATSNSFLHPSKT
jgi:hypothetical protein